jgi:hypothetical protein
MKKTKNKNSDSVSFMLGLGDCAEGTFNVGHMGIYTLRRLNKRKAIGEEVNPEDEVGPTVSIYFNDPKALGRTIKKMIKLKNQLEKEYKKLNKNKPKDGRKTGEQY